MIRLAENIKDLAFLPADAFGATIEALAITYGFNNTGFIKFYYQDDKAALSIFDGNVTLCASDSADFEELNLFLDSAGYKSVKCEYNTMLRLGLGIDDSSYIVTYESSQRIRPDNFVDSFELKDIYELLKESGFPTGDYSSFKADICSRMNKGTARFGGIAENEILLTCCFRLFEGSKSVLLGALVTNPAARGRGLASKAVIYMTSSDKPSFLFCRNDSLLAFYSKCGFKQYGKWAISYKER